MVSTPFKNISQNGNLPQIGVKINIFETINQVHPVPEKTRVINGPHNLRSCRFFSGSFWLRGGVFWNDDWPWKPMNILTNNWDRQTQSDMLYHKLQLIIKGAPASVSQRLRDGDAFQRTAPFKGTSPNGRHRLRDSDACQRHAILKGKVPNGQHRHRNCNAFQRRAISKGKAPNGQHRLRNSDACQRCAT